jgi:hypothetical protein
MGAYSRCPKFASGGWKEGRVGEGAKRQNSFGLESRLQNKVRISMSLLYQPPMHQNKENIKYDPSRLRQSKGFCWLCMCANDRGYPVVENVDSLDVQGISPT